MAKWLKYVIIIALTVMLSFGIAYGNEPDDPLDGGDIPTNFGYVNQLLLESSRYTQTDDVPGEIINSYRSTYTLSWTDEQLDTLGFELMFETDKLKVYFEKDSFSMMIENKETGYFWSSRPEFQGYSGQREDNVAARNLKNSGLWVQTVRVNDLGTLDVPIQQSILQIAEQSYLNDGAYDPANPDPLKPYIVEPGSYRKNRAEVTIVEQTANSFTTRIELKQMLINFEVTISIVDDKIEVYIPTEKIEELGEYNPELERSFITRLLSISVFPFMGASREDRMPGYLVIPDGIGALIRTNQFYNQTFQARFYGSDLGQANSILPELSLPIFGNIHEPNANGYYANILEGAEHSTLIAELWGSGTRYHRITNRFNVRNVYRFIINKAGEGNNTISNEFNPSDYRVQYTFLSDEDASYVGIAKDYRDLLIENEILSARENNASDQIPIHLSYIMSDHEPAFIGTSRVEMTSARDIMNAYDLFKDAGLSNQQLTLLGWSRDGFINRAPYRTRLWDRNVDDLIDHVKDDGNAIYFENNYTVASQASRGVNYNRDVARSLSRLKMVFRSRSLTSQVNEMYYLYPDSSLRFAKEDQSFIASTGASGFHISSLGNTLFSYYDGQNYYRTETIEYYREIAALFPEVLLSRPNQYLFDYMSGYMDLPITNSQYDYFTDLVPLIPIVLKGSVSYYASYLNFNALAEDRLLTMVDFGVNPSYVLTEEETYEMRYTPASIFYTTTRSKYQEEIIETYHYLNDALSLVLDASIENREVIQTGLVRVTYDNGIVIYVNYTYQNLTAGGETILARDYKVVTS